MTTEQQIEPQLTPVAADPASKTTKPLPLWVMCAAVGVAAGVFTQMFPIGNAGATGARGGIVVLDTTAIAEAKAAGSVNQSMNDPGFIGREAALFADQMKKIVAGYTSRGVIVINNRNVVSAPPEADITGEVAARLGVNLAHMPMAQVPQLPKDLPKSMPQQPATNANASAAFPATAPGALRP